MRYKRISAIALSALSEALVNIFWYKKDLSSFLHHAIDNPSLLAKLDWGLSKRENIHLLITYMSDHQGTYQDDLLCLMSEVARFEDFSRLQQLSDGVDLVKKAKTSVNALKKAMAGNADVFAEQQAIKERRKASAAQIQVALGVQDKLRELYEECTQLVSDANHQRRGFRLEKMMRELFSLFDLDPRASFKIDGEQIDGAFTFDSTDFLFEAKWHNNQIGIEDLDAFKGKVKRKLENTLGLFLSMSGFSEGAVRQFASSERRVIILMDGLDLMAVLEGRIELPRLLLYKRRQAAETGNIYYKVNDILV